MFGRLLGCYIIYIYFRRLLPPDGILPGAKFTIHPSLAFSHIGSVTARHSSSGRQPNFAAWYKEWNYRTFAEGATYIRLGDHHDGHRPTLYSFIYFIIEVVHSVVSLALLYVRDIAGFVSQMPLL